MRENPDWGYGKIEEELLKLWYDVSDQTVANVLKRHGIPPAPQRGPSASWRALMQHYKAQLLACDFFTVDTLFLQTVNMLFFIELQTRRVSVAGCATQPNTAWVTQQARQMTWLLEDRQPVIHFLIHDRDTKFVSAFDTVFQANGVHVIRTPLHAPNANAFAERWVRTVRHEYLNKLIIANQAHLRSMLSKYVVYYNSARPHPGLQQQLLIPCASLGRAGPVLSHSVLNHDYYHAA